MIEVIREDTGKPAWRQCDCVKANRLRDIMQESGITDKYLSFETYKPKNRQQEQAKAAAMKYFVEFEKIRNERNNSMALLGQVGAGKSHLSMAVSLSLLKKGIPVRYMPYIEIMTHLKQLKIDEEEYQREIGKYKHVEVLLIDDLFKGKVTESDVNITFEIVNYRYLKHLPIIVSSEKNVNLLDGIDEAISSRIIQMCKGYIIEFTGKENNYRLQGMI